MCFSTHKSQHIVEIYQNSVEINTYTTLGSPYKTHKPIKNDQNLGKIAEFHQI